MTGVDLSQNRRPQVYAAEIAVYPLAVVAVVLRFLARRVAKNPLWIDDWFILVAFVRHFPKPYSSVGILTL